jgi:hypothetical protein
MREKPVNEINYNNPWSLMDNWYQNIDNCVESYIKEHKESIDDTAISVTKIC